MNPTTDLQQKVQMPDGRVITVVTPNGRLVRTKNWRLNENSFRAYEAHIREAVEAWPAETKYVVPNGMSPNTFEHRFRDAIQALKLFGYDADLQAKLAAIRAEITISQDTDGRHVWFRAKQRAGRQINLGKAETHERPDITTYIEVHETHDEEMLRAFLTLAAKGVHSGPVQFRGRIDADLVLMLEKQYDTAFVYDEKRNVTTML